MFLLNCIKLFLSVTGKTNQQTKHSSLAIAKMMSSTEYLCSTKYVQCKIHELNRKIFHDKFFLF